MLIATSLAAAALISAPAVLSTEFPSTPPAVIVTVMVSQPISPSLVTLVLREAGDIWRTAGFMLIWEHQPAAASGSRPAHDARNGEGALTRSSAGPRGATGGPVARPAGLHLTIGDDRGIAGKDPYVTPLGWIVFEAGSPLQEIYLSHANTAMLLRDSQAVVGRVSTMTIAERETLIGRAMGRALAHEIGHYLLASKAHSAAGVMQARRGAAELFNRSRHGFHLQEEQRQQIAARLNPAAPVARAGGVPLTDAPLERKGREDR
jgi:hypothetical protein